MNVSLTLNTQQITSPRFCGMHIILMGSPGAGKGTFAQFLKQHGNYFHLCLGDLLRQEIANQTSIGIECKPFVNAGKLIPSTIGQSLFKKVFSEAEQKGDCVIIDGMVQSTEYVNFFDDFIKEKRLKEKFCFIFLQIAEETARIRLGNRLICDSCSRIYANWTAEKKCVDCSATLVARVDDAFEKVISKRLDRFFRDNGESPAALSLVDHYRNQPNFYEFNANQDLDVLRKQYLQLFLKNGF